MAYERNWQFDANANYAPSTAGEATRYILWRLKAFLTGQVGGATQGLWTLLGSSDGVAGAMDGVDRWGATFDAAKIPQAANGSAHGWAMLRSPPLIVGANTRYAYLFLSADSATAANGTIRHGASAPTGSPSATVNPTLDNSYAGISIGIIHDGLVSGLRMHAGLTATGDFYYFVTRAGGGGNVRTVAIVSAVATPKPSDLYPYYALAGYSSGGPLTLGAFGHNTSFQAAHPTLAAQNTNVYVATPASSSNNGTMTWSAGDLIDSSVPDFPLIVCGNSGFVRGRVPDFGITVAGVAPNGSLVLDSQGAVEYALFSALLVPMQATPDLS